VKEKLAEKDLQKSVNKGQFNKDQTRRRKPNKYSLAI
jgi:hypothetical protein